MPKLPRKPPWLRVSLPGPGEFREVRRVLRELRLHTVCEEACCPNLGQCWGSGTATFMILGDTCTRKCKFCATKTGKPSPPEPDEARRVAEAAKRMGLRYVVVTSVTRDDLPDGGASQFAQVVRAVREELPGAKVELLIPDYGPRELELLAEEPPDVLAHNLETVRRLTPLVRDRRFSYQRSLATLRLARQMGMLTKSGIMVGLGETPDEVKETLWDMREVGVSLVTLGQYLQPTPRHLPVARFVSPDEFKQYEAWAREMGFSGVASGPLVRSSHMAEQLYASSVRA